MVWGGAWAARDVAYAVRAGKQVVLTKQKQCEDSAFSSLLHGSSASGRGVGGGDLGGEERKQRGGKNGSGRAHL